MKVPHSPQAKHMTVMALVFGALTLGLLAFVTYQFLGRTMADRYIHKSGRTGIAETRADPFRIAGCVRTASDAPDACNRATAALLAHATALQNTLKLYTRASRDNSPNTVEVPASANHVTPIKQGRHVALTLDRTWAERAQTTVDCYTGTAAACAVCPWCSPTDLADWYEGARVRAMGLLVVNAQTGAIEAAASAYTPCYRQQHSGTYDVRNCPRLPDEYTERPYKLGSQVFDQQGAPGSITKLPIHLGLQRAGLTSAESAALPSIMAYSQTVPLLDIIFCKAARFDTTCAAKRINAIAAVAAEIGLDGRSIDVLAQGHITGLYAPRFAGRFMHQATGGRMTVRPAQLSAPALAACSALAWKACKGEALNGFVAEFFGTGDVYMSPVGVAALLLNLHADANGMPAAQPHLVAAAQNPAPRQQRAPAVTAQPRQYAQKLLHDLEGAIAIGSAHSACMLANKSLPGGRLPCAPLPKTQALPPLKVASKTGTTVFSADTDKTSSTPLKEWTAKCKEAAYRLKFDEFEWADFRRLVNTDTKCAIPPNKWFGALVTDPQSGQTHAIVVLAERNWNARTQLIQGHNEIAPNIAAEAALALANALYHPSLAAKTLPARPISLTPREVAQ